MLFTSPDSAHMDPVAGASLANLRKNASQPLLELLATLEALFAGGCCGLHRVKECQAPLRSGDAFYGVGERCVAIESLRFLALAAQELRGAVERLAPRDMLPEVDRFYNGIVGMVPEVREAMYRRLPNITIRMDDVKDAVLKVKWDSKEIPEKTYSK